MTVDYYGNKLNDQGEYVGSVPYAESQMGRDAIAANDALQAAVEQSRAADDAYNSGWGSAAAVENASMLVTRALKTYTEVEESHIDATLTPGPQTYSEPETIDLKYLTPSGSRPGATEKKTIPTPVLLGGLALLAKLLLF